MKEGATATIGAVGGPFGWIVDGMNAASPLPSFFSCWLTYFHIFAHKSCCVSYNSSTLHKKLLCDNKVYTIPLSNTYTSLSLSLFGFHQYSVLSHLSIRYILPFFITCMNFVNSRYARPSTFLHIL